MPRSEVYSWRLSPALKEALEEAAREANQSLASLLEDMAEGWLAEGRPGKAKDEQREQERLRARAQPFIGSFGGGDPERATQARERLRAQLSDRHRARPSP
jgi:hypothetical protein